MLSASPSGDCSMLYCYAGLAAAQMERRARLQLERKLAEMSTQVRD